MKATFVAMRIFFNPVWDPVYPWDDLNTTQDLIACHFFLQKSVTHASPHKRKN